MKGSRRSRLAVVLFAAAMLTTISDAWWFPSAGLKILTIILGAAAAVASLQIAIRSPVEGGSVRSISRTLDTVSVSGSLDISPATISEVIHVAERELTNLSSKDPDRFRVLGILSDALRLRFVRLGKVEDLMQAVRTGRAAIVAAREVGIEPAWIQAALSSALRIRFARLGDIQDLNEAVDLGRTAVTSIGTDSPVAIQAVCNLATTLRMRFTQTGTLRDLDDAVELAGTALAMDPENPHVHEAVGQIMMVRAVHTGADGDLDRAIDLIRSGLSITGVGTFWYSRLASNLGGALLRRFERSASLVDLDEAVTLTEAAIAESDMDPDRAKTLSIGAYALEKRFSVTRSLADIDAAIDAASRALDVTKPGRLDYSLSLLALGRMLLVRHNRIDSPSDLDRGLRAIRSGADALHPGHIESLTALSDVIWATHAAARRSSSPAGLETAIYLSRLLAESPAASETLHERALSYLTNALVDKFVFDGALEGLDEAVAMSRSATQVPLLLAHSRALYTRFWYSGALIDLDTAISIVRSVDVGRSVVADGRQREAMLSVTRDLDAPARGLTLMKPLHGRAQPLKAFRPITVLAARCCPISQLACRSGRSHSASNLICMRPSL